MGARLCNYLSHHLTISSQSGNFRQLLLRRSVWIYEIKGNLLLRELEFDCSFYPKTVWYRKFRGGREQTLLTCVVLKVHGCMSVSVFSVVVSAFGFVLNKSLSFPKFLIRITYIFLCTFILWVWARIWLTYCPVWPVFPTPLFWMTHFPTDLNCLLPLSHYIYPSIWVLMLDFHYFPLITCFITMLFKSILAVFFF